MAAIWKLISDYKWFASEWETEVRFWPGPEVLVLTSAGACAVAVSQPESPGQLPLPPNFAPRNRAYAPPTLHLTQTLWCLNMDCRLLGCDVVWLLYEPTFRKNVIITVTRIGELGTWAVTINRCKLHRSTIYIYIYIYISCQRASVASYC
jgi:hypothetical protein